MKSREFEDRSGDGPISQDPVCGMKVEKALASSSTVYRGAKVFFCSDSCRATFLLDPEHYWTKDASPSAYA